MCSQILKQKREIHQEDVPTFAYRERHLSGAFNFTRARMHMTKWRQGSCVPGAQTELCVSDLSSPCVTQMKSMCIPDVRVFPYPTPPEEEDVDTAITTLVRLGALTEEGEDITPLGRSLAAFP